MGNKLFVTLITIAHYVYYAKKNYQINMKFSRNITTDRQQKNYYDIMQSTDRQTLLASLKQKVCSMSDNEQTEVKNCSPETRKEISLFLRRQIVKFLNHIMTESI